MRRTGTPLRLSLLVAGVLVLLATAALFVVRTPGPARTASPAAAPAVAVRPAPPAAQPVAVAPARRATARRAPAAAASPAAASASLGAYIDPETGTFGAPPAPMLQPEAAMAPVEEPYVVTLPSGAEMLVNSPPDYVVASIDANGRRVIRTVSDPRQARLVPAPATKPVER
jgi:hypothetical protein